MVARILKWELQLSCYGDYKNYFESACHDEDHGGQNFKIGATIVVLWRFKA